MEKEQPVQQKSPIWYTTLQWNVEGEGEEQRNEVTTKEGTRMWERIREIEKQMGKLAKELEEINKGISKGNPMKGENDIKRGHRKDTEEFSTRAGEVETTSIYAETLKKTSSTNIMRKTPATSIHQDGNLGNQQKLQNRLRELKKTNKTSPTQNLNMESCMNKHIECTEKSLKEVMEIFNSTGITKDMIVNMHYVGRSILEILIPVEHILIVEKTLGEADLKLKDPPNPCITQGMGARFQHMNSEEKRECARELAQNRIK
ncbi:hypothetical protein K493DRAFT_309129 [Basidiobolus meristosporus CBS 931.73]|uniref:Uncharacterized protein n=1 Tax=Basidiobolus meristosporus CBS 931.73 TaxID=1314790 RepID=A0A1Y1WRG4_9FUNG|nr:hypothetical protein K493DRAFT_309129 [Basidiobolus meristosporus CBS 931.73]|eukprot:ORX75714.1 hypothetical protein K493DRAFT_309129 [Basidiobolus meristosporus CBS 931.73]